MLSFEIFTLIRLIDGDLQRQTMLLTTFCKFKKTFFLKFGRNKLEECFTFSWVILFSTNKNISSSSSLTDVLISPMSYLSTSSSIMSFSSIGNYKTSNQPLVSSELLGSMRRKLFVFLPNNC
jgi:hypothetical protein